MQNGIFPAVAEAFQSGAAFADDSERRRYLRKLSVPQLIVAAAFQSGQAGALHQLRDAGCTDPLVEQLAKVLSHGADLIAEECRRRKVDLPFAPAGKAN